MPMHRFRFVLPASLLIGCATASATTFAGDDIQRIAHAGGGYRSWQYTNSLEALDFNRDYFTLFEIDFSWTRDEKLVCLHDWKLNAERIFGQAFNQPATLAEFQRLVANNPYVHSCTLDSLRDWLVQHPDKRVVTDIKHHNLKGLARLAEQLGENASQHIIPQIYTPEEYQPARDLGFKDIIWTLYRYAGDTESILEHAGRLNLYAITMPRRLAESGLAQTLSAQGVQTYVHTLNTQREVRRFRELGIDNIYTDWLPAD